MPPVHVALVGIEKVIANLSDYATLTQLLPRSATGQAMTVYTQLINGPRRADEPDGPEHVYVIFVDNGRTAIYAGNYAEALACIRCGACLNGCPVYQVAGGHAYGWVYPGPIGAVITPLLVGPENAALLPFASTLCGVCQEVCPVDIDIPRMLLDLRADLVDAGHGGAVWNVGLEAWSRGAASPALFGLGGDKHGRLAAVEGGVGAGSDGALEVAVGNGDARGGDELIRPVAHGESLRPAGRPRGRRVPGGPASPARC